MSSNRYSADEVAKMRQIILDHLPNAGDEYKAKLKKMPYNQLYAMSRSMLERDAKKKIEAERKKNEPHQMTLFEWQAKIDCVEKMYPYGFRTEDDRYYGLVKDRWMEFVSEEEYEEYLHDEKKYVMAAM